MFRTTLLNIMRVLPKKPSANYVDIVRFSTQDAYVVIGRLLCNLLSNQTWRNFDKFFTQFLISLLSSWVSIKCINLNKRANQLVRYIYTLFIIFFYYRVMSRKLVYWEIYISKYFISKESGWIQFESNICKEQNTP